VCIAHLGVGVVIGRIEIKEHKDEIFKNNLRILCVGKITTDLRTQKQQLAVRLSGTRSSVSKIGLGFNVTEELHLCVAHLSRNPKTVVIGQIETERTHLKYPQIYVRIQVRKKSKRGKKRTPRKVPQVIHKTSTSHYHDQLSVPGNRSSSADHKLKTQEEPRASTTCAHDNYLQRSAATSTDRGLYMSQKSASEL
jgi:hypothetical protein